MNAAQVLVKALEHEGVQYIFGLPGEENLDVLEAIRNSSITLVVARHEQAAGFMAATYGRLTGKAGVCLSTLGPGATNFVTSAAHAQLGGMPMIMITGQKPIKRSKQGRFQIIDVVDMMRPITKWATQIVNGDAVAATVREAFRVAEEERPGAVHIELPEDVAAEPASDRVFSIRQVRRPLAEKKALQWALDAIEQAKKPLVLVGAGANRKLTSNMLNAFIDKTQIPFFCTQMGKGVVDERHGCYLGCAALSRNDLLHCAIDQADLIINVGHDVIEKPPFIMEHGDGRAVIHINFYSARVDDVYFPQIEVVGDIANAIWYLTEKVTPQAHWDFSYFRNVQREVDKHIAASTADPRFPLVPQRIVADVRRALPEDGVLTLDNGMYKIWFARQFETYHPNTLLLDNALATMGAGLPSALAAKLVFPDKKVMTVVGDGGFLMNSQELETAVRLNLDLVVVILNDSGYGMIKWKQEAMGFSDFGLDFGNPDFVQYAQAYGATGHRITATDMFVPTLQHALQTPGVHVIDVPIDYSENTRVFEEELATRNCDV